MAAIPQHLRALKQANRVRCEQSRLKHRLKAGELTLAEAMRAPCATTMPIGLLLRSQRRWGPTRARRALLAASVPELKAVGALTERQRNVLLRLAG